MFSPSILSPEQLDHFLTYGHIVLHECFTRETAEALIRDAYEQLGYSPDDPTTWEKPLAFLFPSQSVSLKELAPTAYQSICQLIGGEARMGNNSLGVGQWVINFSRGSDEPWRPPSPDLSGWHIDGNFFRHFLDSPEQGLLVIPIFSDIEHQGGGTFLAADSVPFIAGLLRDHPEGLLLNEIDFPALLSQCRDFREVTGSVGDVVLVHPLMIHNFSQNHSGKPRFITNICVSLKEPMNFNRAEPAETSPVEQAILNGLGVERLDFEPIASRERVDPKAAMM